MYSESQTRSAHVVRALLDRPIVLLLLAVTFFFAMWFYNDRVWGPPVRIHFSDLYPRWYGAHELLLHHRDPYSPAVTREIQTWLHGRPQESNIQEIRDEDRFAYPVYLAFVLGPTVVLPFSTVESIFRMALPLVVVATALFWILALRWRVTPLTRLTLVLFTLGSFPILECLYLQQPALLAAFFLAGSVAALSHRHLTTGGVLLALATVKPQFTVLLVLWLLLWAASDFPRRMPFLRGFFLTMAGLLGVSQFLVPGWIPEFLHGLRSYIHYTGNESILSLWFTQNGGSIVSAVLLAGLALICWKLRGAAADSARFLFTCWVVLTITLVTIPTMYPTGQILLVPVVFSLLQNGPAIFSSRWQKLTWFGALCVVCWPWLGAVAYLFLSALGPINEIRAHWLMPVSTHLVIPAAILAALATRIPDILKGEHASLVLSPEQSLAVVSK